MIDFILGISALIVFGGGWYFIRRSGVKDNQEKQKERDNDNAQNIRDRVSDATDRVRNDEPKYRD